MKLLQKVIFSLKSMSTYKFMLQYMQQEALKLWSTVQEEGLASASASV